MEHRQHLVSFDVVARPSTFATAHEHPWKEAVREAVAATGVEAPLDGRFAVRIEFRTVAPTTRNEQWDIDNLVKPTLDAMEGVFGLRNWRGVPQPADDRVDHLEARKRAVANDEEPGAFVEVWLLVESPPAPE